MPTIKITKVQCSVPDEIDKDEMYLKHRGKKVWPVGNRYFRMDTGDKVLVDLLLDVESGWVEVELWDFDYLSFNDHLGTFRFNVDAPKGEYSTTMDLLEKGSTASYIMHWEVV
ncbi:hypothetical protein N6H18_09055 [Reichenbachiella agarivorans]|uniref:Uncharacterized protein n=1 Tax=Reichenbachiella agarivorans TaxID=2979464 RepID=A0ABY6CVQ3_9BACT|nr:hypothetical protein [Reichenbachiella agarivorans]UXP34090.1 hypothetical protein N6H18_09055 [Reichenbachiella agarivorans]